MAPCEGDIHCNPISRGTPKGHNPAPVCHTMILMLAKYVQNKTILSLIVALYWSGCFK
jgi:hypothetical protein